MGISGDLSIGSVVCSLSGRDVGKYYLVLMVNDAYLQLIDGDTRRVDNPKRKNSKHVRSTGLIASEIVEKLASGRRPTNPEVRKSIAELRIAEQKAEEGSSETGDEEDRNHHG